MDGYEDTTEGKKWRPVHTHFVLGSSTVTSGARSGDRHKQEKRLFTLFTVFTLFFDSARRLLDCKNSVVKVRRCKFVRLSGRVCPVFKVFFFGETKSLFPTICTICTNCSVF